MINATTIQPNNTKSEAKSSIKTTVVNLSNAQHRKLASFDEISKIGIRPYSINSSRLKEGSFDSRQFTPIKNYYHQRKESVVLGETQENKQLKDVFYEESGSATKKCDFIKLQMDESNLNIKYGNGLFCKTPGKSPLLNNLKFPMKGDIAEESICSESSIIKN